MASTFYNAFERDPMSVWQQLLRRLTEVLDFYGHAAIDTTCFDRQQASYHYLSRIDLSVRTIQATFLVDTTEGAMLDLHCSRNSPIKHESGRRPPFK